MLRILLTSALLSILVGCKSRVEKPKVLHGLLKVEATVADAEVWLNETYVADVSEVTSGIRLVAPKAYRLELRHENYHVEYRLIELLPNKATVVKFQPALMH